MENLIIFIVLVALGYSVGTYLEKRHFRSILEREAKFINLPAVTLKSVNIADDRVKETRLVYGSAVISVDYFKRVLAGLRNIFGGRVTSYETLIDRARREAQLRMKEMAGDASLILNLRIETATIAKKANNKGVGCLEAIAYGTAVYLKE